MRSHASSSFHNRYNSNLILNIWGLLDIADKSFSSYTNRMNIPPITLPNPHSTPSAGPWAAGELPPGPPMPADSPWVKSLERMFPRENSATLAQYASQLSANMMRMLSSQIAHDLKKARERARKMKEAIL